MAKLILVRHGTSLWNKENRFTGWENVDLAPEGIEEAKAAGRLISDHKLLIDVCFSSFLKRAIRTNLIILEDADQMHVDCYYSHKLNERHYGDWQGRDKDEVRAAMTKVDFEAIHRGLGTPPPLALDDARHPQYDGNYRRLDPRLLPATESLMDTQRRVVNYYHESIAPHLARHETVLITAHGNSLRALIAKIEERDDEEIPTIIVPTATPFVYELDDELNITAHHKLG